MAIYLDGQPADLAGDTLGAVIDAARARLAAAGRLLVEVSLNGEAYHGDDLRAQRQSPVGGGEVILVSADPRELAGTTLQQVRASLEDARAAQHDAAERFQQDQPAEAMQQVGRAIEVWQGTQQAVVQSARLVGIDLNQRVFENQPMSVVIDSLVLQLRSLRDLLSAGDTVGLADSLAYEWPELTDRWDRLLGEMIVWTGASSKSIR